MGTNISKWFDQVVLEGLKCLEVSEDEEWIKVSVPGTAEDNGAESMRSRRWKMSVEEFKRQTAWGEVELLKSSCGETDNNNRIRVENEGLFQHGSTRRLGLLVPAFHTGLVQPGQDQR